MGEKGDCDGRIKKLKKRKLRRRDIDGEEL